MNYRPPARDESEWPRAALRASEYRCECCGGIFEKIPGADELALAEMLRTWGELPQEERASVCDPCGRAFDAWNRGIH